MNWNPSDLDRIASADELELSSRRPDGSARPFITMWSVVVDGDLYVRSAYGPGNGWYRRALASGRGAIRAAGVELETLFTDGGDADQDSLDREYHRKYDRYGARIVGSVVGADAHALTVKITPV